MVKLESEVRVNQFDVEKKLALEIERKFLVRHLPDKLSQYEHSEITQGYLAITEDDTEVRLRREDNKYYQTIKIGSGVSRIQLECEITQDQFDVLWPAVSDKVIKKTRYKIPHEGSVIELDIYQGNHEGLITTEVEFDNEEKSKRFVKPEWFGEDVTKDSKYKNKNLALFGIPEGYSNIPVYNLEQGVQILEEQINERVEMGKTTVVLIAGSSASGKGLIVKKFEEVYGSDLVTISLDDYYRGKRFLELAFAQGNNINLDQPEALDLDLAASHIKQLDSGEPIEKPVYDFVSSETYFTEIIESRKIIMVEGLFALDDKLADIGDIRVYVNVDFHGRAIRRLMRDVRRTGQSPLEILSYITQIVEPMYNKYVEPTKKSADLIISNEYQANNESRRSENQELQIKFKTNLSQENLEDLGAEKQESVTQIDNYYSPNDLDLAKNGELLRIRQEGDRYVFAYKGPRQESNLRKRQIIEFEINSHIAQEFIKIYGDKIITIKKQRTFYEFEGYSLALDKNVLSINKNGKEYSLGDFIEFGLTSEETGDFNQDDFQKILSRLSLEDPILKSYSEFIKA